MIRNFFLFAREFLGESENVSFARQFLGESVNVSLAREFLGESDVESHIQQGVVMLQADGIYGHR